MIKYFENSNRKIAIEEVYENELCTGCGTCAGMCQIGAIEMVIDWGKGIYKPLVNSERCNNCGFCYKICPGHSIDFKGLKEFIFSKQPGDIPRNNHDNYYVGYSTDCDVRRNSSSGGLVTQLLIYALEKGFIDGALVTKMKKDKPLESKPFIARTKEDIISASGSKFSPVAVNVALREVLNSKQGEKFAVVGLPCHIHGIRKAEKINAKLKKKIVLHFGLFCNSYIPTFIGIKYFLEQIGIKNNEIKKIDYRRGEFPPGMMCIEHRVSTRVDHLTFWNTIFRLPFVFSPWRCTLCCDSMSDLSDASFGSWWQEEKNSKIGSTAIVCRNEIGEKIVNSASQERKISVLKIDSEIFTNLKYSAFKEANLHRFPILKFIGKKVPEYNLKLSKPRWSGHIKNILFFLELFLASKKYLRSILSVYIAVKKCTLRTIKNKQIFVVNNK